MLLVEKIIKENQEEFLDLVIKFVTEKTAEKTIIKQKRTPKTVCHFNALGKTYDSNVFKKNYENFLIDTSKILSYDGFKQVLKGYVRIDANGFPKSHEGKTSMIKLSNGGFVTCYSGTTKKLEHIKGLCNAIGITLTLK